jgi:hypothetical protein
LIRSEGGAKVHPVPESEALLELLVQWEELRRQSKTATAEELCPEAITGRKITLWDQAARLVRLGAARRS